MTHPTPPVGACRPALPPILMLILLILPFITHAQPGTPTAAFDADTLTPAIGQPLTLTLTVTTPPGAEVIFPTIEGDWGDFTVLTTSPPTIQAQANRVIHTQTLTAVAWGLGELSTPLTQLQVLTNGSQQTITVDPLFITVPVILDDQPQLRTARRTLSQFHIPTWTIILASAGLLSLFTFGGVAAVRFHSQRTRTTLTEKVQRTIGQRTLQSLKRLEQDAPDWITQYTAMGDTLRFYLTERYHLPPDLTTTELLDTLPAHTATDDLRYLLHHADLAKFAPQHIIRPQDKPIIPLALDWLKRTEHRIRQENR